MAVYKIFPTKDASIYSNYPTKNAGIDEILDISLYTSIEEIGEVSRALLAFSNTEISDILSNKINLTNYKAYLKLYLANASSIPLDYTLYCHPISGSWVMGTGRAANVPETSDGVSWKYRNVSGGSIFTSSIAEATNAYNGTNVGGGSWYTGSNLIATQSFNYITNKDIELDVTNAISSSYYQNGFIVKHSSSLEFNASYSFETKYFSTDTHTIYSPCLEFRWNDYIRSTSLTTVTSDLISISLSNNKGEFQEDSVNRFKVNVRDRYPTRTFQTSSLYLNNKVLPTSSYYAIKDIKTEEFVIDFDTTFTKLSADANGNYFDLYMNGLQPERYYQILIKSVISGSTVVHEDNNYFKVIR
jgi:hypothetical protein